LTTRGTVELADGSSIGLTPGGQVSLAPNSTLRIDPSSAVRISGMVPADARASNAMPVVQTSPALESKVITQYTTFKTVAFENGHVVTGWRFDNSNQTYPSNQYCYFDEPGDGKTHVRTDLGENGTMFDHLQSRVGLDMTAAFGNCYWYRGG
jgi:hypothetical protein